MQANNTNNTNKTNKKIAKKARKLRRGRRLRIGSRLPRAMKRANIMRGKRIAAASAQSLAKKFTVLRQNGNSVRVTGRDLIYPIPDTLTAPIQTTNVIAVIPANPAYWTGTRIAALASGYQNYRPIKFKINYIPMCAVTQQGNVIGGTIWDDGLDNDNIQQSLRTSNGGFLTQCYVPHSTVIRPKTNLQFNLYRVGGDFDTKANPFLFIAIAIGCKDSNNNRIVPGYFYVTWSFELKNPVGANSTFYNTGLVQYSSITPQMNNTMVNLLTTTDIPFGAYIDLETDSNNNKLTYYNGTQVTVENNTPVWCFSSVTKGSNRTNTTKINIIYSAITTENTYRVATNNAVTFDPIAILYDDPNNNRYVIYEFESRSGSGSGNAFTYTSIYTDDRPMYIITEQQVFGVFQTQATRSYSATTSGSYSVILNQYYASKDIFTIALTAPITKQQPTTNIHMINQAINTINNINIEENVQEHDLIEENEEEEEIEKLIKNQPIKNKAKQKLNQQ